MEVVKKIMHIMRHAPHGNIYTYEGLEMVLIMAAYDQDITLSFIGDGVYALHKHQDTTELEIKGYMKTFSVLEDYDVEKIYVDAQSLRERGLRKEDLIIDVEIKDSYELGKIIDEQDVVIPH